MLATSALALAIAWAAPTSGAAQGCPNEEARYGYSRGLSDCRAYELVSPADKDANTLVYTTTSGGGPLYSSESGEAAFFAAVTPFAHPRSGRSGRFISNRGASGWETINFQPRLCLPTDPGGLQGGYYDAGFSRDFSTQIVLEAEFLTGEISNCDPEDQAGVDVYAEGPDGGLTWISRNDEPKTEATSARYAGANRDASRILFTTPRHLTPADGERVDEASGLYERAGSQTTLVGVGDDGAPPNRCGSELAGTYNGISQGGRVVFFASGEDASQEGCGVAEGGGEIYARIDGADTVQISGSELASPPERAKVPLFRAASEDGSTVIFSSFERLTDDATEGGGLYEYDLSPVLSGEAEEGTLEFLTPAESGEATIYFFAGMSPGAERIYFVSYGVLAPGAPESGLNLYTEEDGAVDFIAPIKFGEARATDISVSRDGGKIVYPGAAADETRQFYLYDAESPGGGDPCVSCVPGGASAEARLRGVVGSGRPPALGAESFVTDDGRVFFSSPDQLVPEDANDKFDVYEYVGGERRLLSPGTSSENTLLVGVTGNGRDVFFVTNDSLVAQDYDNGDQDLYDARVDGGFPPPDEPTPCTGAGCRPDAGSSPESPQIGSRDYAAPVLPVGNGARCAVLQRAKHRNAVRFLALRRSFVRLARTAKQGQGRGARVAWRRGKQVRRRMVKAKRRHVLLKRRVVRCRQGASK